MPYAHTVNPPVVDNDVVTTQSDNALTDLDPILAGFESVPSDALPFITLDAQQRFYLNATLRKLIKVKAYDHVALAYNPTTYTIAILTGLAAKATPNTQYHVDKRHYMSARRFMAEYRYSVLRTPYKFEFQREGTHKGVYLFKLVEIGEEVTTPDIVEPSQETLDLSSPATVAMSAGTPVMGDIPDVEEDTLPNELPPPAESLVLTKKNRLHIKGLKSVTVYVKYDITRDIIHLSFDEIAGADRVNVNSEGLSDEIPALKGRRLPRPATYYYDGFGAGDTLTFKRAAD